MVAVGALALSGCLGAAGAEQGTDGGGPQRPRNEVPYWVNPHSSAARQLAAYREQGRHQEARLIARIATQPTAEWLGTEADEARVRSLTRAATAADRESLLVLYNIPHRDCGQYSRGGARDGAAYRTWLAGVLRGIGQRAATVVVEPDALPHLVDGCTPPERQGQRYQLLREATRRLAALPHVRVYLDAGNPRWITDPRRMAEPLRRAGVSHADGFALNTSNYQTTEENIRYGRKVSAAVGGAPFVIDTSRNGRGPAPGEGDDQTWCNPAGRGLGEPPTTHTRQALVDAYLWVKRPGESDGPCKGGPPAGEWWPAYALRLARNAR